MLRSLGRRIYSTIDSFLNTNRDRVGLENSAVHALEERIRAQSNELVELRKALDSQISKFQQTQEIAKINEERFRNMADNIQDGLTIIENGKLVYINERACEIFGDCPEGTLEQRIHRYAQADEIKRLQPVLKAVSANGEFPHELQYWIINKNDQLRCIHERYSNSWFGDTQRTFVVTSDITQQIQDYQNLEHLVSDRTQELTTVLEVSKKIASTLELEPLLNLILDQIVAILPYSGAAIFTLDDDMLDVAAYHVPGLSTPPRLLSLSLSDVGPYQPVVLEKQVMILDDVHGVSPLALATKHSKINLNDPEFSHARSWLGIPLVIRDRVMGLLSLTHSIPGFYTKNHARLAQAITNQVAIALENARLYEKAQNLATLEERNRIARELHDSVTQLLYGITLYCTATSRSLQSNNLKQVEQNLIEIKDNALQALQEMRLLILELNPPLLQKEGLVAALEASLDVIETRTGLETELINDEVFHLPRSIEPGLYRIAMEALNNLVRYARAKKVTVELQIRGSWVFLDIRDNGVGFNLDNARNSGGMGLISMEQRALQLGGRLEIESNPGAGTRIHAEVPLK